MRAQGSLEYMVIIAAVLGIAAIVILYTSGVIGTQTTSVSIGVCKQAAEKCKLSRMTAPADPCTSCISACASTTVTSCSQSETAKGVSRGAIGCCKKGESDQIYEGATGCGTVLHMVAGVNHFFVPLDWEATTAMDLLAQYPSIDMVNKWLDDNVVVSFVRGWSQESDNFNICPNNRMALTVHANSAPFDVTG